MNNPIRKSTDRRTLNRYGVTIPVKLREGRYCQFDVTIVDISCWGCRVDLGYHLTARQDVVIAFAGLNPVRATMMWSEARQGGFRFATPFHSSVLRHLVTTLSESAVTDDDAAGAITRLA